MSSIRGSKVGSGPAGAARGGPAAPSQSVSYWCGTGHETPVSFALDDDVVVPTTWVCRRCGSSAGLERADPPRAARTEVFKTHLEYVEERRDAAAGAALLDEALTSLRERRIIS